jgi:S1-C subfamily serine protease
MKKQRNKPQLAQESLGRLIGRSLLGLGLRTLWILLIVGFSVTEGQQMHLKYLRNKVSKNVVMIKDVGAPNGGGGTGFHVKAASGKTYILTNHHVCNVGKKEAFPGKQMLIFKADGSTAVRKIIATYDRNDLCLIEGVDGVSGLSVASDNTTGDIVSAVGHPHLRPITMTRGELAAESTAEFLWKTVNNQSECKGYNMYSIPIPFELAMRYGTSDRYACIRKTDVMLTTVQVLPGSSGSPTVNYFGQIVGVVYLGMTENNWSGLVPLRDIKRFLSDY